MKKKLLMVLSVAMVAVIAITGTMAYLTSTDSDVNVMTVGNVQIKQVELERVSQTNSGSDQLQEFTQNKPLVPSVGERDYIDGVWQAWPTGGSSALYDTKLKNVVDKFVFVENTGKSDAYVRTVFAFEAGDLNWSEWDRLFHLNINGTHWDWEDGPFTEITIDDVRYFMISATYTGNAGTDGLTHKDGVLGANETTRPSLLQYDLDSSATNEDVKAFGDEYEILVLSQAVQAEGFASADAALDEAFGDVNATNAANWFTNIPRGFKVSNSAELADAITAGEKEIWLNPGTYHAPVAAQGKTLTINGTKDAILEVVPAGQGEAGGQLDYSFDGSTVIFNGITIKTNSQLYAGYARLSGTYNDCVIQNTYNLGIGTSAFNNCVFNITNEYLRVGGASVASFTGCTFNTDGRAILVFQDGTSVAQTVTVKDCTFNATAAANTWNGIHVAAVSIDGTNGTYVVNLEGNNTVDSDFNGLWQIKAGETNVTVNE